MILHSITIQVRDFIKIVMCSWNFVSSTPYKLFIFICKEGAYIYIYIQIFINNILTLRGEDDIIVNEATLFSTQTFDHFKTSPKCTKWTEVNQLDRNRTKWIEKTKVKIMDRNRPNGLKLTELDRNRQQQTEWTGLDHSEPK